MEMEQLADELPIGQVARRWIVASEPEEAVERIRPYVDAGFNHLVVHGPATTRSASPPSSSKTSSPYSAT